MILLPSDTLPKICRFCRGHRSDGEYRFINDYLKPLLRSLGKTFDVDYYGNITVFNGDSRVLFVAHIDTVHRNNIQQVKQTVTVANNLLALNDNGDCLGADDGAGISVLLYLLSKDVKGTYVFTRDEECGGLGAAYYTEHCRHILEQADIAVEIDRRGTDEIVYAQDAGLCAGLEFTQALCEQLGMGHVPSDCGSFTDVALFAQYVPECVNIAAGYMNAHTPYETADLCYLDRLAERLAQLDWHRLPITRQPGMYGSRTNYDSRDEPLHYCDILDIVQTEPLLAATLLELLGVTEADFNDAAALLYEDCHDNRTTTF